MNMPDRDTIESIFLAAVELPPDQRQSFLDQRCGDDPVLIAEVKKLIDADQQAGAGKFLRSGFLDRGFAAVLWR